MPARDGSPDALYQLAMAKGLGGFARADEAARGLVDHAPPARGGGLALAVQQSLGREIIGGFDNLLLVRGLSRQRREHIRSRTLRRCGLRGRGLPGGGG